MNLKTILLFVVRVIALTIVYLIAFVLASAVTIAPVTSALPATEDSGSTLLFLPLVALVNTLVLVYVIVRARWRGWKLTAAIALAFYGVYTFMTQIESAVFPGVANRLPPGMLSGLFVMGLIQAVIFAPLAVLIMGKWKPDPGENEPNDRLVMPPGEWVWKLAVVAFVYLTLYLTFGYYIAWRNPAVQAYYGGTDPGSFGGQLANIMRDTPWLPFFQLLRGLMWTLIALPVIRTMKGAWWQTGLAVGLIYAVLMNSGLILPNPIMPPAVRMAHLVETGSSNFIFGWVVAWLLHRHTGSAQDLVRAATA